MKIKIIGGTHKGFVITQGKKVKCRPLTGRVKENIFNILLHSKKLKKDKILKISECNVLDLFAGIGSFGIESLSRGAKSCCFIDSNYIHLKNIKENLSKLTFSQNIIISKNDITKIEKPTKNQKNIYNVVFIDPPYQNKIVNLAIKNILQNEWLAKDAIIIIKQSVTCSENITKFLKIIYKNKYGSNLITFAKISN